MYTMTLTNIIVSGYSVGGLRPEFFCWDFTRVREQLKI